MIKGRVQATLNLSALQHNFVLAKLEASAANPAVKMLAVVKANAYGNGLAPVAQTLVNDADAFGVTDVTEALALHGMGTGLPIVVMQGLIEAEDLQLISQHNFQLVVSSLEQLQWIDEAFETDPPPQPLTFWLKADTGMGRLGLVADEYVQAFNTLSAKPYTKAVVMMTHLANSSLPDHALNDKQLNNFNRLKQQLDQQHEKVCDSIPASAGLFRIEPLATSWARPGIMLYGSSPFHWDDEDLRAKSLGIHTVSTLQSRLIAVKEMKKGDNVGYCSQYICPHDMTVGIVSIGYADGYPSNAPNGTPVLVNGERTSTIGRVSMDMLAVDLSPMPEAMIGDVVTLWGEELSIDEVAAKTGILSYNLMSSLTRRVNFVYLD